MDGQGLARANPYLEKAGATYTSVIDTEGITSQLYGFKTVANGFLVDESGILKFTKINGFDIRRQEISKLIEHWVNTSEILNFKENDQGYLNAPTGTPNLKATRLYRKGIKLYESGQHSSAINLMRAALEHDPDNIIIHRHIWAIENPDKFYKGEIDQKWKQDQTEKGL